MLESLQSDLIFFIILGVCVIGIATVLTVLSLAHKEAKKHDNSEDDANLKN